MMVYRVGFAKTDITPYFPEVTMLGYGHFHNVVRGVATPLYARTCVISQQTENVAFVSVELCFITTYLREGIISTLIAEYPDVTLKPEQIMLTAQHTHSAPGGYEQHLFYNLVQTGFRQEVCEHLCRSVARSIADAYRARVPATLHYTEGEFGYGDDVAFNRSLKAYNANPEVERPVTKQEAHIAVDRKMKLLGVWNEQGQALGCINWFGVHTTSLSNDNTLICSDNKGYAAHYTEQALSGENGSFVALFAQDAAGDVSPNYVWDKRKGWTRGRYADDFESAQHNGRLQAALAIRLFRQSRHGIALTGPIRCLLQYRNMSAVTCDPDFTAGRPGCTTVSPCFGMSFLEGTAEGPGAPKVLGTVVRGVYQVVKAYDLAIGRHIAPRHESEDTLRIYREQYPKTIMLDAGRGRLMAARYGHRVIVPGTIDPTVRYMKQLGREGWLQQVPWVPVELPLQMVQIGSVAWVGVPAEVTVVAGEQLRSAVRPVLEKAGVSVVQLCPYANAYSGYITTYHEYRVQAYEGGHTLFGRYTLAGYQTVLRQLAGLLLSPPQPNVPTLWPKEQLWKGFRDDRVRQRIVQAATRRLPAQPDIPPHVGLGAVVVDLEGATQDTASGT